MAAFSGLTDLRHANGVRLVRHKTSDPCANMQTTDDGEKLQTRWLESPTILCQKLIPSLTFLAGSMPHLPLVCFCSRMRLICWRRWLMPFNHEIVRKSFFWFLFSHLQSPADDSSRFERMDEIYSKPLAGGNGKIPPQMVFWVKTWKSRSLEKIVAPLSNEQALNVIYGSPGRNEMKCMMVDSVNVCHPCGPKFSNQS